MELDGYILRVWKWSGENRLKFTDQMCQSGDAFLTFGLQRQKDRHFDFPKIWRQLGHKMLSENSHCVTELKQCD